MSMNSYMIPMGNIIAQRLHEVVLNGELGFNYTFSQERDKNRVLRRKCIYDHY